MNCSAIDIKSLVAATESDRMKAFYLLKRKEKYYKKREK
jgi:hypothetical protein